MVTTIQLNENVKKSLDKLKENTKETYEEVITRMMRQLEEQKRNRTDLIIEGCKEMYEDMLKMNKELETIDSDIDWEWK